MTPVALLRGLRAGLRRAAAAVAGQPTCYSQCVSSLLLPVAAGSLVLLVQQTVPWGLLRLETLGREALA
jgi:hypothetical protein